MRDLRLGLVERRDPVDAVRGRRLRLTRESDRRKVSQMMESQHPRDREPARGCARADEDMPAADAEWRLAGGFCGLGGGPVFAHATGISRARCRKFPRPYWIGVVIVRRVLAGANR